MKYLYLFLNLGSLTVPFLYSFHPRMRFIRHWKAILASTAVVASFFLIWDAWFTARGIWGFNSVYYLGYTLLQMPIEEWLFFFCIPYASLFIHFGLEYYFPKWELPKGLVRFLTILGIVVAALLLFVASNKAYTFWNALVLLLVLLWAYWKELPLLRRFYISFLLILIPFFMVNGVLTGSFIENEVVWYNNAQNLGIRLGTIPIEDIGYCFSMLFTNLILFERWRKKN